MIIKKLGTVIATATLLAGMMAPIAHADTTIEVTGNGADSSNHVTVSNNNTDVVEQSNVSSVTNLVTSTANSGELQANENTGGSVSLTSGKAVNNTTVMTVTGGNMATITNTCGCASNTDLTVADNGADSHTKVKVEKKSNSYVGQSNYAGVLNSILSTAKSGKLKANENTGGSVTLTSKKAKNTTVVGVTTGTNTLVH